MGQGLFFCYFLLRFLLGEGCVCSIFAAKWGFWGEGSGWGWSWESEWRLLGDGVRLGRFWEGERVWWDFGGIILGIILGVCG